MIDALKILFLIHHREVILDPVTLAATGNPAAATSKPAAATSQ